MTHRKEEVEHQDDRPWGWCTRTNQIRTESGTEATRLVVSWIAAREAGDAQAAAGLCADSLKAVSPTITLSGLAEVKRALFHRPAPAPAEILQPLTDHGDGRCSREIVFQRNAVRLNVRQEFILEEAPTGGGLRIGQIITTKLRMNSEPGLVV